MRITFDDGGYLEFQRSKKVHHVYVLVASRNPKNHLELLVNSAEVHINKLIQGVKSVTGPVMLEEKAAGSFTIPDEEERKDHEQDNSDSTSGNSEQ